MKLEDAVAEREVVVREIRENEQWLASKPGDPLTQHLKWKQYHLERAERVARNQALGQRAATLRKLIATLNVEAAKTEERTLVSEFYHGVCQLEESGVDIGDRLRAVLKQYEDREERFIEGDPVE